MSTLDRSLSSESPLTSLSSEGSDPSSSLEWSDISVTSRKFMNDVKDIISSSKPLADIVNRAEDLIAKLASHEEFDRLPYGSPDNQLKLSRALTAMLHYAEDCGGQGGKWYTGSAICACRCDEKEATLRGLQSLGTTWVSHLLFVCKWTCCLALRVLTRCRNLVKGNGSHKLQQNPEPSEYATLTLDDTFSQMVDGGPENRADKFKNDVSTTPNELLLMIGLDVIQLLKRDGYRCVATGLHDVHDPKWQPDHDVYIETQACPILRRAVGVFDASDPGSAEVCLLFIVAFGPYPSYYS
jgi:hypothetical protein